MLFVIYCLIHVYSTIVINAKTITNSSGQYFLLSNIDNYKQHIKCTHHLFCYIQCIANYTYHHWNDCDHMTLTTTSSNVMIDCEKCSHLKVFSQTANYFTMQSTDDDYGELHIENVSNIDIRFHGSDTLIIFAQYAENFIFSQNGLSWGNIFFLDFVSDQITFQCYSSQLYDSCIFYHTTIVASSANYFSLTIPEYGRFQDNIIYCPSQPENACDINFAEPNDMITNHIYISDLSLELLPLNFYQININGNVSYYRSYDFFTLWCNENKNKNYESNTDIYYNAITQDFECKNITSECCYLNNDRTKTAIFCDKDDDICSIDCTIMDCSNTEIHSTNSTNGLYVDCGYMDCFNTIIHCPTAINSSCFVSCDTDQYSCYYTVIKYNTNNKNINLNCINTSSCEGLQIFVDKMENNNDYYDKMKNINFNCSYCSESAIIINTEIEHLTISCNGPYPSCTNLKIDASLTQNITVNCFATDFSYAHACDGMVIYGKSDAKDSIHLNCEYDDSCSGIEIISELQYQLDYISMNIISRSSAICPKDIQIKCKHPNDIFVTTAFCTCDDITHCCPFSNAYPTKYYCDHGENCHINLDNNHQGTIIYANDAKLLDLSCNNCSNINIFANHASKVEIKCTDSCYNIQCNAMYVETFILQCLFQYNNIYYADQCRDMVIDVSNANNVIIKAALMNKVYLYALNAHQLSFECMGQCSFLNLAIPPSTSFYFGDTLPDFVNIYSLNEWNDIANITVIRCDKLYKTEYSYTALNSTAEWKLHCVSPVNIFADTYGSCQRNPRLQRAFCECDEIKNNPSLFLKQMRQRNNNMSIQIIYEPWSNYCRIVNESAIRRFHTIFGIILACISFTIIICLLIIVTKHIFLKYCYPIQYHAITYIQPPSTKLLFYLYLCDVFTWITQIYIVIIISMVYKHYKNEICETVHKNDQYENDEKHCLLQSACVWHKSQHNGNQCIVQKSIKSIHILMITTLCVSGLFHFASLFPQKISFIGFWSHFANRRFLYNQTWFQHYLNRQFFTISKSLIFYYLLRYALFFAMSLTFYFLCHEMDFNINLNDILPLLLVFCFNEMIKIRYRMLIPYDENKHIQYNINKVFGENVGYIIWIFLSDESNKGEKEFDQHIYPENNSHETTELIQMTF
eukprot:384313_1